MSDLKGIPARIKENIMVLPSKGGVSEFCKGKEGFVAPERTKNSSGILHFVWLEPWSDGMGGSGRDVYYVPAFSIELLE